MLLQVQLNNCKAGLDKAINVKHTARLKWTVDTIKNCTYLQCTVRFTLNCLIQSNVEVTVKNCKSVYNYSTVVEAAIKCKPYSEITVEIGTHLKTVKITLNIFAVY